MKNKILTSILALGMLITTSGWVMSSGTNDVLMNLAQEQKDDINKKSTEIANLKNVIVKKDDGLKSNKVVIDEQDSQINKLKKQNAKVKKENSGLKSQKKKLKSENTTLKAKHSNLLSKLREEQRKKKVISQSSQTDGNPVTVSRGTPSRKAEADAKRAEAKKAVASNEPQKVEAKQPVAKKAKVNGNSITVSATAYIAMCDTGCTGITATGVDVRNSITYKGYRVIAVDPSVIPLHTVVTVSVGGQSFTAIAVDTGGAIRGHKIDILVGSQSEAINFGRQQATITF